MRLVCPNCDAQYEVDAAAIPEAGRDVQCSSCGHAWFQLHPDVEADNRLEEEVFARDALEAIETPIIAIVDAPDTASVIAAAAELPAVSAPLQPDAETEPPRRRPMDESVLAVLREEADRETAVRRTEAPRSVEVQAEMGLQPPAPAATAPAIPVSASVLAAREKFRELSEGVAEAAGDADAEPDARPASRRELLPDIEEINSTLRSSGEPRGDGDDVALPPTTEDRRNGFRSGFVLMIVISVGLWMTYTMSPRIVAQIPASHDAMQTYVSAVNKARLGVDKALQSASKSLRNLSGQDG